MTAPNEYQVFLSHDSRDKAIVREVRDALESHGVKCWLDEEELQPGRPWQDLLESGIRNSLSVAVFCGAHGVGQWQAEEAKAAVRRAVENSLPVIPVLVPGATGPDSLPLLLANRTWVDLRDGLSDAGIMQLLWGITGERRPLAPSARASDGLVEQLKVHPDEIVELEVDVDESFFLRAFHGPEPIYPTIIARLVHRFLNHDRDRTVITRVTASVWAEVAANSSTEDAAWERWTVRVPDRSLAIPPPAEVQRVTEEQLPDKWFSHFGPGDVPPTGLELERRSVSDWLASEFHLHLPGLSAGLPRELWVRFCWHSLGNPSGFRIYPVPDHALPSP